MHRDEGGAEQSERRGCESDDHPRVPLGGHERDREHHDEETDHARLRVREPEAGKLERNQRGGRRESQVPEEVRDQHDRDPEREVAPIQARVLEHRADAEERRVGVLHGESRRVQERVRRALHEPDHGEHGGQKHERCRERARLPRREACPREYHDQCCEWEDEEGELDTPLLQVARPQGI